MRSLWVISVAVAGALCLPAALHAKEAECQAEINGEEITIRYDREAGVYSSFRERRFTRRKTCPGAVVVAHMMPGLTEEQRGMFCANYDKEAGYYRSPAKGERDAYGRCANPSRACRIVNATKQEALEIGALGVDAAASGVSSARDASGAMVLTGKASAVAGFVSTVASGVAAAVTAPGTLAAAAVSVVVVGGAVYVCG